MLILKAIGKMFYRLIMLMFYMTIFPFRLIGKLCFFWVPKEKDSYETDDDEWLFWKEHGHEW